ncbi:MAG: hypothetical protein LUI08_07140 [Prevotella sp.]|nr:hypothetical protein [Prevotella sp.]
MKQNEAVIETMKRLGGVATLGQLNQEVFKIKECEWHTKTPFASIRRIVQLDKNIYKIRPGLYGLVSQKKELEDKGYVLETDKNTNSNEINVFNHSYYQGLLLQLGNMKGLNTYVPKQDKNRMFLQSKLDDFSTIKTLPGYTYPDLVKRSATIDVIWFNRRNMPHSFFEIEHTTDIQNSLLKFNDLQDFHVKMLIVADKKRKPEFINKLHYSSFYDLAKEDRVKFLDYNTLSKLYEKELEVQFAENIL